ncbi:AAA family ATPase [Hydrogenivirga sp.]
MRSPVVIFGLSGSGKSFLARILHDEFGYEWLRSDVIRKEIMGLKPEESARATFGGGIYTEDITRRVYEELIKRAKELSRKGKPVVLDATFLKRWQRELVRKNFEDALFILATAGEEEIKRRLSDRKDVSDADFSIYLKQKEVFEYPSEITFVEVNTERSREELISVLKDLVED